MKRFLLAVLVLIFCVALGTVHFFSFEEVGEGLTTSVVLSGGLFLSYILVTSFGKRIKKMFMDVVENALEEDRKKQKEQQKSLYGDLQDGNELRLFVWSVKQDQMIPEKEAIERLKNVSPETADKTAYAALVTGFLNTQDDLETFLELLNVEIQAALEVANLQAIPGRIRLSFRGSGELQSMLLTMLQSNSPKLVEHLQFNFGKGEISTTGRAFDPISQKVVSFE